jgi:hypothetical protein
MWILQQHVHSVKFDRQLAFDINQYGPVLMFRFCLGVPVFCLCKLNSMVVLIIGAWPLHAVTKSTVIIIFKTKSRKSKNTL